MAEVQVNRLLDLFTLLFNQFYIKNATDSQLYLINWSSTLLSLRGDDLDSNRPEMSQINFDSFFFLDGTIKGLTYTNSLKLSTNLLFVLW